jgi:aminoglycoside phosphotransferase (APT) family kinase protein
VADGSSRSAPPHEAIAWVEATLGPGRRVVHIAAMPGATSSAVHALDVIDRRGRTQSYVLRRYTRADWLAREPDLAEREAEVLVILEGSAVPTPVLVGADVRGHVTDVPAVLMTRLDGAPIAPAELSRDGLRALAALLPPLHATAVPAGARVRAYRPHGLGRHLDVPSWSTDDRLWARAIAVHRAVQDAGAAPSGDALVHRDYHPGNVLFGAGREGGEAPLRGLVDWVNASRGAPDVDVGHCRFNLVGPAGADAADAFRDAWLDASGRDGYDPTFDVVAVVGALGDWPPVLLGTERRIEGFVAAALAEIGA